MKFIMKFNSITFSRVCYMVYRKGYFINTFVYSIFADSLDEAKKMAEKQLEQAYGEKVEVEFVR